MSGMTKLDGNQVLRSVYDESTKKLKVDAQVNATVGSMDIVIDAAGGDNIAISDPTGTKHLKINADGSIDANITNGLELNIDQSNDSVRIGDGVNLATTTTLQSKTGLDVNLLNPTITATTKQVPVGPTKLTYGTITGVNVGITSTIVNYTAPSGQAQYYLQKVYISGDQNSSYILYKNSDILIKTRMAHTQFSQTMDLNTASSFGIILAPGDVVRIDATNGGVGSGTFDATLQFMEIEA